VHPDGMFGYVKRIGAAPDDVSYDDTEVYAVGAFLLAGTEVLKWRSHQYHPSTIFFLALTN